MTPDANRVRKNKLMIKLVATDIDGTILIPDQPFTQEVKDCINKLKETGIKVVLVTGRMNAAAEIVADELQLDTPLISYQGGLVKQGGKTIYEKYLSASDCDKIIDWAHKENIHINLYNDDTLYSEDDDYEVQRYCKRQKVDYIVKDFSKIKKDKVNKILAIDYGNTDRIDRLEVELQDVFPHLYIVKSAPFFLEFSNPDASKYCAVKFLQEYWGIKQEETLTIGDQNNDIALLKAGGVKVAMANATEELKDIADYITDSVENNGFVVAMEELVLTNQN